MQKKKSKSKNNLKKIIKNIEKQEENPFEYLSNASDFLDEISSKATKLLENSSRSHNMYDKLATIASIFAVQMVSTLKKHAHYLRMKAKSLNEMNVDTDVKGTLQEFYDELLDEDFASNDPIQYIEDFKENLDDLIELYNKAEADGDADLELHLTLFAVILQESIEEAIKLAKAALPSNSNSGSNSNSSSSSNSNNSNVNMKSVASSSSKSSKSSKTSKTSKTSKSSKSSKSSKTSKSSVDNLTNLFSSVLSKSFSWSR